MKLPLLVIGYWHGRDDPHYPDPAWFVDSNWDPAIRRQIIDYLKKAPRMHTFLGQSWCRFDEAHHNLGAFEQSDGKYIWPEGLAHYLEAHDLRLPDSIVEDMLRTDPTAFDPETATDIDYSWWKMQKGWRRDLSTSHGMREGMLTIKVHNREEPYHTLQEAALLHYLPNTIHKLKTVKKILAGETVAIPGRFFLVQKFIRDSADIKMDVQFLAL